MSTTNETATETTKPPAEEEDPTVENITKDPESATNDTDGGSADEHSSLKYHLLGQSATKAGLALDQSKISEIIYEASKGSKYFQHEEQKDKLLTEKISKLKVKAESLPTALLATHQRNADLQLLAFEEERDLTQHIVHVDCDAFFASVEELDRPELKHVPFAVGFGVLTTANYHARKFGCRSGMASFVAKKLCPHLILIQNNHAKYGAKAEEIREVLVDYDPRFESASIDEAYLNITSYCAENNLSPEEVVDSMRARVAEKTKITVSAGIAANTRIAKICSNMNKPNGQYVVPRERDAIMSFIGALPARKINGIGRVLERELAGAIDVHTVSQIYDKRAYLVPLFGEKTAHFLLKVYLGLGRTHIQPAKEYQRKSVGTERTFADLFGIEPQKQQLQATAKALAGDLAKCQVKGRTLVLKVKLHTYEVYTRQVVANRALSSPDDIYDHALPILLKLQGEFPDMKLRLMGLRCTNLVTTKKPDALAFFGIKPGATSADHPTPRPAVHPDTPSDAEWEVWPEAEIGPLEPVTNITRSVSEPPTATSTSVPAQEPPEDVPKEPEFWPCPVCGLAQAADERKFNEHIDLCLSRQTIKEAVQESESDTSSRRWSSDGKHKKRGRSSTNDPKQKKLCFG